MNKPIIESFNKTIIQPYTEKSRVFHCVSVTVGSFSRVIVIDRSNVYFLIRSTIKQPVVHEDRHSDMAGLVGKIEKPA